MLTERPGDLPFNSKKIKHTNSKQARQSGITNAKAKKRTASAKMQKLKNRRNLPNKPEAAEPWKEHVYSNHSKSSSDSDSVRSLVRAFFIISGIKTDE